MSQIETMRCGPSLPGLSRRVRPSPAGRPWLAALLLAPGLVALVAEPLVWLWGTWSDPSYQSDGALVAALVVAMGLRSLASGPAQPDPNAERWAWRLFCVTALVRLAGRLLAVNTIGALALVVDVYALALLLGVARRPWAIAPLALAAFSVLALPVEHLAQRLLAHPLQWLAAQCAEFVLAPFFPMLTREGTLLLHPAAPLSIDLPCSGARGIVLLSGVALALLCRYRATPVRLLCWGGAVFVGALLANTLRIVLLFLGTLAEWPVADEPTHSAIGSLALCAGLAPLLTVVRGAPLRAPGALMVRTWRAPRRRLPTAVLASAIGVAVALAPERPIDVSPPERVATLPARAGTFAGEEVALLEQERRYFTRYGGGVQKRVYRDEFGPSHTALLVHTRAPLRHLHGPDRCLIGAGHRVTRIGVRHGRVPTIVYRSEAPDGRAWRVEASFVSDAGASAGSVSEVVWRWLEAPEVAWNLVERISPWETCAASPARCASLDAALFAALDVPHGDAQLASRIGSPRSSLP